MPIRTRVLLACIAASAALAAPPAWAQGPGSPRESVLAYLKACRDGNYEDAARYLDLRDLPASRRAEEGERRARQLKVVLDQKLWVDLDALSGDPDGDPDDGLGAGRDRLGTIETEVGPADLILERARAPEEAVPWRFSRTTVARIPALYEEFGFGRLGEILPAPLFTIRVLEIELWQWLALVVLVLLAWGLGTLATLLLLAATRRITARTRTSLDDRVLNATAGPLLAVLGVGIFYMGSLTLGLALPAQRLIGGATKGLLILAFTWLAMRIIDVFGRTLEERVVARGETSARTAVQMGSRIAKVFLVVIALLSGLQNLGFNVTGIIAGLGVGGIAVALAAQKTFENFFGGMSILVDRPIEVGQFCRFGDQVGTIEQIGLRSTRVRTLDRTLVTIPNAEFSSLKLENFAARDRIRFFTVLGVRYETSADQLRYLLVKLRELLLSHPCVDPDPARIRFVGFGASSLDLEIFAYVTTPDWNEFLKVREDLLLRIIDAVEESGTGFAFPSQTLYVGRDDGLDAERTRGAVQEVAAWRSAGALCLPDFPPERVAEIARTIPYPPEGSATAGGGS